LKSQQTTKTNRRFVIPAKAFLLSQFSHCCAATARFAHITACGALDPRLRGGDDVESLVRKIDLLTFQYNAQNPQGEF